MYFDDVGEFDEYESLTTALLAKRIRDLEREVNILRTERGIYDNFELPDSNIIDIPHPTQQLVLASSACKSYDDKGNIQIITRSHSKEYNIEYCSYISPEAVYSAYDYCNMMVEVNKHLINELIQKILKKKND